MSVFELVDDDTDLRDLLVAPASAVPLVEGAVAGLLLEEAAVHFDAEKHPRWPKGTPKGGEFIRVGQSFGLKGQQYEVAHIVKGKVYAHLKGGKQAQTIEVKTKELGGGPEKVTVADIEAPTPSGVKGGKGQESTVTAISPYVDHASHDPSIPIPTGSSIKPEEWLRFGKLDQEHYSELQERFGAWKPAAAKPLVDKAYTDYQAQLVATMGAQAGKAAAEQASKAVKSGYSMQYGSSSGVSLSLIGAIKKALGGHGKELSAAEFDARERAMVLQGEHKAAVQWDLYNRSHSPDIAAFHKSSESTTYWDEGFIKGSKRIFSGLSQSFHYRASFFGDNALATPLAIRHVLLATQSAQPIPGSSHFPGELEISVPEQLLLDKRSLTFTFQGNAANAKKLSPGAKAWLESVTKAPVGGKFIEQLSAHFEKGEELPIPPEPAMIQMDGAGGKLWKDPEPHAWKDIADRGVKTGAGADMNVGDHFRKGGKSFKVTAVDAKGTAHGTATGGDTETLKAGEEAPHAQSVQTAGIKVGDYVMGLQGSRYVVVADPGDPSGYGLTYVEGNNNGPTGSAFHLKPGGARQFYRLEGSYQAKPVAVEGKPAFDASGWTQGADAPQLVAKLNVGDKFKVEGTVYEVTDQLPNEAKTRVRDMDTGKYGKINQSYKTPILVPKEGYVPPPPEGSLVPEPGDFVAIEGEKWEVQGLQNTGPNKGQWKLKRPGKPGMTFLEPSDPLIAQLHRPGDYVIGPKEKLRDIPVGHKFHVGAGAKQKPYVVLAHGGPGKKSVVRDLTTGKDLEVSRNASYSQLLPADAVVLDDEKGGVQGGPESPKYTPTSESAPHDPTAYVLLPEQHKAGSLAPGTKIQIKSTGIELQIVGHMSDGSVEVSYLSGTKMATSVPPSTVVRVLSPKSQSGTTPYEQLTQGDLVQLDGLKLGDQFTLPSDKIQGAYVLVDLPDDDGYPVVALVGPSGATGPITQLNVGNATTVQFHKFATDSGWTQANSASAGLAEVDPAALAAPPDFAGYTSAYATGGKEKGGFSGKHARISEMAIGTVFRDKAGNMWKTKTAGAQPIITDGKANYQADGQMRGRASTVLAELPGGDTSPPIGQPGVDDVQAGMLAAMVPNSHITAGMLNTNDLLTLPNGKVAKVTPHTAGDVIAVQDVASGKGTAVKKDYVPSHFATAQGAEAEGVVFPTTAKHDTTQWVTYGDVQEAGDLPKGAKFQTGSGDHYEKIGPLSGDYFEVKNLETGEQKSMLTFQPAQLLVPAGHPLLKSESKPTTSLLSPDQILQTAHALMNPNKAGVTAGSLHPDDLMDGPPKTVSPLRSVFKVSALTPEGKVVAYDVVNGAEHTFAPGYKPKAVWMAHPLEDDIPSDFSGKDHAANGSPGRGPSGVLRNFQQMKDEKLLGVLADQQAYNVDESVPDTEAEEALLAVAKQRGYDLTPTFALGHPSVTGKKLADLPVGSRFSLRLGGYDPEAEYEVLSAPDDAGDVKVKIIKSGHFTYVSGQYVAHTPPPKESAPAKLADGLFQNSGYVTMAQLLPGDVVQMGGLVGDEGTLFQVTKQPEGTGTTEVKVLTGPDAGQLKQFAAHWSPVGIGNGSAAPSGSSGIPSIPMTLPDDEPSATREVGQLAVGAKFVEAGQTWTVSGTKVNEQIKATSDDGMTQFFHPLFVPEKVLAPMTPAEVELHDEGFDAGVAKAQAALSGEAPPPPTYSPKKDIKAPSDPLQSALAASLAALSQPGPALSPQDMTMAELEQKYGTLADIPSDGEELTFPAYKSAWGSGGAYKHPAVGTLSPGTHFVDKTGAGWTMAGMGPQKQAIVVSDETGAALRLSASAKVKLTQ